MKTKQPIIRTGHKQPTGYVFHFDGTKPTPLFYPVQKQAAK